MKYCLCYLGLIFLVACAEKNQKQGNSLHKTNEKVSFIKSFYSFKGDSIPILQADELEWMAENLSIKTDESWCYDDQALNCEKEGRLYSWESAKDACNRLGEGWRLPTDEEWKKLSINAGGYFDYLTEKSTGSPKKSNEWLGVDGLSGFNASRNGWRGSNGGFSDHGVVGFFWSSTELDEVESWFFIFHPKGGKLIRRAIKKRMGMSCRCVRFKT
jgi:uncharacterized protein (TIGR02145 family)